MVTSASVRRIPRRSCESSQRADKVGSDRDVQVDVLVTSLFSWLKIRGYVNVRVFFREKKKTPEILGMMGCVYSCHPVSGATGTQAG